MGLDQLGGEVIYWDALELATRIGWGTGADCRRGLTRFQGSKFCLALLLKLWLYEEMLEASFQNLSEIGFGRASMARFPVANGSPRHIQVFGNSLLS
mgnify:CR=1 FL=1